MGLGPSSFHQSLPKFYSISATLDLPGGSHLPAELSTVIGFLRATPLWQDPLLVVEGPRDESGDTFRELRVCVVCRLKALASVSLFLRMSSSTGRTQWEQVCSECSVDYLSFLFLGP